jgi:methylmalonyl-CoA mutase N-terminal domain/subunit
MSGRLGGSAADGVIRTAHSQVDSEAMEIKAEKTSSGIPVEVTYGPERAGEFPFTRGIQATMYRGRVWTMRQYAGMGDAEESNRRYKFLLANGAGGARGGLSVAFDLPTQIGFDSDHAMALGEVGNAGVAIDSIDDMARLFEGIPLDTISTSMTINATAAILLAMYVAVAKRTGAAVKQLSGTIQNDILKEYIARGTYIYPVKHALRLVTDTLAWVSEEMPEWNPISVSGYHMREAGATAVQELAFTLANGMTYVQAAIDAGMQVDAFAPRMSFFFNAHNNLFEEVAKFRAARRMWARVMRDRFAAKNEKSWMLRFHTQTAGSTLTAVEPENNIVRTTLQGLAGVLGGTQSLHTNGYDEALALPTERAAKLALRTQQVIAFESGVTQTVDPLAGSYYVEALTDEIERRAGAYLQTIEGFDASGGGMGMLRAIEHGYVQQEIQRAAYAHQREVETAETAVVGVNRFASGDALAEMPVHRRDVDLERRQVQRVRAVRARRDKQRWTNALQGVADAARDGANLMPKMLDAVESEATVGEIADKLREVFGEFREMVVV